MLILNKSSSNINGNKIDKKNNKQTTKNTNTYDNSSNHKNMIKGS